MIYEEYRPPPGLQDVVAAFWTFELEASDPMALEHVVPPDGTLTLACSVAPAGPVRAVVVGPRLSALRVPVHRGVVYAGVRTRPGAGAVIIGDQPAALRERVELFERLSPNRAREVGVALRPGLPRREVVERLQAVTTAWRHASDPPDAAVTKLVDLILAARGDLRVRDLGRVCGLGYRQALRRFQRAVGLSPKELARLVRIRWACVQAIASERPSWASVSVAAGFADQAHLAREFSEVFGWPPALVLAYLDQIDHVRLSGTY